MNVALAFENKISFARRALFVWRFRHQERLSRFALGMAYALGHQLTEADRHALRVKMNEALGYYPLMTLATEDVLQNALEAKRKPRSSSLISTPPAITSHANGTMATTPSALPSIGRSKTPWLMPKPTESFRSNPSDPSLSQGEPHAPLPYRPYAE
jgi:hypothetical protein